MSDLAILRTISQLRATITAWRQDGQSVALVPTMGALHDAHMALMREARTRADRVVATIFVNPTQFAADEDLDTYPRREATDIAKLQEDGIDLLFAPDADEIYPPGFATTVTVAGVSEGLCGDYRPGHFSGVATVVTKLLLQALPDVALFGEKDYQQLQVIRGLARDLDIPVSIVGVPTVREADGLAMSSRNLHMSSHERTIAPQMYQTLTTVAERIHNGDDVETACAAGREALTAAGFAPVEYLELRDAQSLAPGDITDPCRILAAAWLGDTRLIDNIPLI
ncbi:MAG: pantoate--beta-alanine ligase [Alphaproteobacteria bacterium]|nr:pantoate--beta-alanine ligase [Alphaproteobacteria bacterium]